MLKSKAWILALLCLLVIPAGSVLAYEAEVIWWAEYYDNPSLKGNPVRAIREAAIDFDWGQDIPLEGVPADGFSVRWTTTTTFEAGHYTFSVTIDDGARLWVDGELLIDQWRVQGVTTYTAGKWLAAGEHTIQMAYFEDTGSAVAKLWWRRDSQKPDRDAGDRQPAKPAGKKLVIDNRHPGFTWGGPGKYRNVAWGGYGNDFFWTKNTVTQPSNYGKWTPTFAGDGEYEVYVYIPGNHATTAQVRYRIFHNGERRDRIIDQDWYFDQWVSLGVYYFNGKNQGQEFIIAYDNTREPAYSKMIAYDAIKLVPR